MNAFSPVNAPGHASMSRGTEWLFVAIVLMSLDLRPAIVAVGPLTAEIRADTGLSTSATSLLMMLPLLAARLRSQRILVACTVVALFVELAGLLFAAAPPAIVGAIALGIARGSGLLVALALLTAAGSRIARPRFSRTKPQAAHPPIGV